LSALWVDLARGGGMTAVRWMSPEEIDAMLPEANSARVRNLEEPEDADLAWIASLDAEAQAETRDDADMEVQAERHALRTFQTRTWADLMAEPAEPPPMIRPGVPEIGVTVLAGPPKIGKTLWVSQVALEAKRRTLLIIEEGTWTGLSFRLRTQAAHLGLSAPPIEILYRSRTRLDDPEMVGRLRQRIDVGAYQVVEIDPLNRAHSADENRPTEMTRVMDGLAEIAYGLGIAVLAVHHLGKPSAERRGDIWDRFRGASSIRSGTDANLAMEAIGSRVELVGEFRDAEPLHLFLELDRESLTFRETEPPKIPGKIDRAELDTFLADKVQITVREVAGRFGASKNTAQQALDALGLDTYDGPRGTRFYLTGTAQ
jgi:hypothetical protein